MIQQLKKTSNPISKFVEFWLDSILEGYITEIAVNTIKSCSEIEREFFQEPKGHYLKYLKLWINMLVCEKGILQMESDE